MTKQALQQALLDLPHEERAELLDDVLASLPRDPEIEAAWAIEIERRLGELERGEVATVPAEQVFAEARRRSAGRG